MAIIKCKMCGGDLNVEENSQIAVCEYCGTQQTVPKQDNEKKLTLFARANRLRFACEFDKAAGVYESIVAEFPEEAEAYWGLVLCKYGIEYVDDPATGKKVPTCHRSSFDSVLEDANFELVMEYSDVVTRKLYREEAKAIEELRRGIIEVSSREEPYDIFICYKETDENGQRTLDSVLAQDLYDALTEKGYRVFFSRITLEDKLGQEYEPYIFAALNSARVMLAVGTDYEYFNAPWVKNEWSRYLQLIAAGQKKSLIPCYKNIDAYDMPKEFAKLQAQDLGKVGATQDLLRGIEKLFGRSASASQASSMQTANAPNVDSLLRRGTLFLEDNDWTNANTYFDKVLDIAPECGAAYLGKYLVKVQCRSAKDYVDTQIKKIKAAAPNKKNDEACEKNEAFIASCVNKYTVPQYLTKEDIVGALNFPRVYCRRADYFAQERGKLQSVLDRDKDFVRAEKFSSGETKMQCNLLRKGLANALHDLEQTAKQEDAAEKQRVTESYRAFLQKTEPKLAAAQSKALAKKQADEESAEAARLAQEAHEREARRTQRAQARAQARKRKALGIAIAALALGIALALVAVKVIIPSQNYAKAAQLCEAGEYDAAIALYEKLGRYRDAAERLSRASAEKEESERVQAYSDAEDMMASGNYTGAIAAFEALGDYQDAAKRLADARLQSAYADAIKLQEGGEYDSAIDGFTELGDYKDAAGRLNACLYAKADQLAQNGDYQEAYLAFAALGAYQDAAERSRDAGAKYFQQLRENYPRPTISAGYQHAVAVRNDGTCLATPYLSSDGYGDDSGQCNVSDWTDLISVAAGYMHTVGLKADGTVLATTVTESNFDYGQSDVSNWTDIVAVAAGTAHTLGLRKDGTVVSTTYRANDFMNFNNGQCNVSDWTDIIAIDTVGGHSIGLKGDGTVVVAGRAVDGGSNISDWENIIAIADGDTHIVGLRADGTVVAVGDNQYGECNVSDWADIVAIDAEYGFTIGLKSDGTVVSTGDNQYGQCNVSDWTDIVAVSASAFCTIGLRSDGTLVATEILNGDFLDHGQNKVSGWSNIKLPN